MIDVDHFKQFNDIYGHQVGDNALKIVAGILSKAFLRGSDFVARYGGEEFVVLSAGMTKEQAASFAEKLCQQVRSLGIPHSASSPGGRPTSSTSGRVKLLHPNAVNRRRSAPS
jgi:diguanylate cyclase (GGDEF)-like protein